MAAHAGVAPAEYPIRFVEPDGVSCYLLDRDGNVTWEIQLSGEDEERIAPLLSRYLKLGWSRWKQITDAELAEVGVTRDVMRRIFAVERQRSNEMRSESRWIRAHGYLPPIHGQKPFFVRGDVAARARASQARPALRLETRHQRAPRTPQRRRSTAAGARGSPSSSSGDDSEPADVDHARGLR